MINMVTLFKILLLIQLSHFVCDYVFTTKSMIEAKAFSRQWFPIFQHACIHGLFLCGLLMLVDIPQDLRTQIFIIETSSHFAIDYLKGLICRKIDKIKDEKKYYILVGMDQYAHQIMKIVILYVIFNYYGCI